jgi:hypothetical protein
MISAIVLAPDLRRDDDISLVRETIVRSLIWLVSAVIAGVVRDVILAAPTALDLSDIADQAGCVLVQADRETDRLAGAIAASRSDQLLVIKTGYQSDGALVEDIEAFVRRAKPGVVALVHAAPEALVERLFPNRSPVIGVLIPRSRLPKKLGFAGLLRSTRKPVRLRTRAVRIG